MVLIEQNLLVNEPIVGSIGMDSTKRKQFVIPLYEIIFSIHRGFAWWPSLSPIIFLWLSSIMNLILQNLYYFCCLIFLIEWIFLCSLYEIGNVGPCFDYGTMYTPEPVWPAGTKYESKNNTSFGSIWSSPGAFACFPSSVSCIRRIGSRCSALADDASSFQRALYPRPIYTWSCI